MLCEPGISVRQICRTLHVSHNTLSSIQEREAPKLDTRKKVILNTVTRGLRLCAERVEELAPEMTARDALIGVGILGEKMQLLGGDPTTRIDIGVAVDIHSVLFELDKANQKLVDDYARAQLMGVEGENAGTKGSLPAGNLAGPVRLGEWPSSDTTGPSSDTTGPSSDTAVSVKYPSGIRGGDGLSDVSGEASKVGGGAGADLDADALRFTGASDGVGRGSDLASHAADSSTDSEKSENAQPKALGDTNGLAVEGLPEPLASRAMAEATTP
jgi:hypothetical protein